MITRKQSDLTANQAKSHLKKHGWSYRDAAEELGYSFTHIAFVLTGRRHSQTLLGKIMDLPKHEKGEK